MHNMLHKNNNKTNHWLTHFQAHKLDHIQNSLIQAHRLIDSGQHILNIKKS